MINSKEQDQLDSPEMTLNKESFLKYNALCKSIEANLSVFKAMIDSAGIDELD